MFPDHYSSSGNLAQFTSTLSPLSLSLSLSLVPSSEGLKSIKYAGVSELSPI